MIEKVVKAFADCELDCSMWYHDTLVILARVAIEAMREPTDAMISAVSFHADKYSANEVINGAWCVIDDHRSARVGSPFSDPDEAHDKAAELGARDAIEAMLDAALNEKTNT
jgi:hypothetical protein